MRERNTYERQIIADATELKHTFESRRTSPYVFDTEVDMLTYSLEPCIVLEPAR